MRYCFLISSLTSGGAERTVAYLANYFVKLGNDVDIVLYGDRGFYELDSRIKVYEIAPKMPSNAKTFTRINYIFKRFLGFRSYYKINCPDLIFSIIYTPMIYALPYKAKSPIIISERGNPATLKSKLKLSFRKIMFKKANGIVFQTKRAKDYYKSTIGNKGIIIPNAIGNEFVFNIETIFERKKKISAMGRLSPQKGYPTLLKAFKLVSERHSDYSLEIFGKGELEKHLKNIVKDLGIEDKVFFAGTSPDAIIKIADASCYVLSSIYEGMPNALMEAMAVGLPCVSTDCPNGPAELIENGENGLLVPIQNEQALAKAILKMIEDKEFAEMCGKSASKIKETHSMDNNAKQYMDFFEKTVKEKKSEKNNQ